MVCAICAAVGIVRSEARKKEAEIRNARAERDDIAQGFAEILQEAQIDKDQVVDAASPRIVIRNNTVFLTPDYSMRVSQLHERIRRLRGALGKDGAGDIERLESYANKAIWAVSGWLAYNRMISEGTEDTFDGRGMLGDAVMMTSQAHTARSALNGE